MEQKKTENPQSALNTAVTYAPFIVVQLVAACCLAAEVLILHKPGFSVTAIPIEILALAYLAGAVISKRKEGRE